MTGKAWPSVQLVTVKGKRLAVMSADDWEAFIEWVETLEDAQIARAAFAELKAAGGDRKRAGWLEWEELETSRVWQTLEVFLFDARKRRIVK